MIPSEVCHYTRKDIALEKILFERKIKFGLLGLTNDPKESKWNPIGIMYPENYKPGREEVYQVDDEKGRMESAMYESTLSKTKISRRIKECSYVKVSIRI